jgi:D-glycero-alpha-D-manno-heptose-7-phosphate kinase
MIISRTPFRVSFFGGGTDHPRWYEEHGGAVLATAIDKYCYLTCRYLPPFFKHKFRIAYSKIEIVNDPSEIQHPAVRAALEEMNFIKDGLEIHHDGDLPARSGLGSSSSFTVGLINALSALRGEMISAEQLATKSIFLEREVMKENVGSQDQITAAVGGFNKIIFNPNGTFSIHPIVISLSKIHMLESRLMLFFTGFERFSSEVAKDQIANVKQSAPALSVMHSMVDQAISLLNSKNPNLDDFGRMLDETWRLKRTLSSKVSTPEIDEIYQAALDSHALGGKLLGAGSGGFLLLYVQPEHQKGVRERLNKLIHVPFKFEPTGSRIVLYQPNGLH